MAQRKQAEAALNERWGDGRARFFNPPPELLRLTMSKIVRERARSIVVVPLWLESPSVARLRRIAEAVRVLMPDKGRPLVAGARAGTEKCPLLLAEVELASGMRGEPLGRGERGSGMGEAFVGASCLSEIQLATLRGGNRFGLITGTALSALVARVQAQGEVGESPKN